MEQVFKRVKNKKSFIQVVCFRIVARLSWGVVSYANGLVNKTCRTPPPFQLVFQIWKNIKRAREEIHYNTWRICVVIMYIGAFDITAYHRPPVWWTEM